MARAFLKYAFGIIFLFLATLDAATSEEENNYFDYERAPDAQRSGEVNEVKRAVALLNRLVMVAQRANKSQRLYSKNENHYPPSPLYKLPAAIPDDPATVEMFNDVNSVENNSDGSPDQKAMALPRLNFERRDQKTPRIFWRCYFNAVSCFR